MLFCKCVCCCPPRPTMWITGSSHILPIAEAKQSGIVLLLCDMVLSLYIHLLWDRLTMKLSGHKKMKYVQSKQLTNTVNSQSSTVKAPVKWNTCVTNIPLSNMLLCCGPIGSWACLWCTSGKRPPGWCRSSPGTAWGRSSHTSPPGDRGEGVWFWSECGHIPQPWDTGPDNTTRKPWLHNIVGCRPFSPDPFYILWW